MTRRPLAPVSVLMLAALGLAGCHAPTSGGGAASAAPARPASASRGAGGVFTDQANAPLLPDPKLTPGATLPVTREDICVPGYTKKVRNVPADVKRQVYAEYGIKSHKPGDYEVDHLISLELGGSNSVKNLWPQSYRTRPWNARVKDALENELHAEVCNGTLDLATAQREIATDWIASYKKHFGNSPMTGGRGAEGGGAGRRTPHPLSDPTPAVGTDAPAQNAGGQVWVNTKSGKYFRPGDRFYGHTKQGQYMTEQAARAQGYVAAR